MVECSWPGSSSPRAARQRGRATHVVRPFPVSARSGSARMEQTSGALVISRPLRRIAQGAVLTAVVAGTLGAARTGTRP